MGKWEPWWVLEPEKVTEEAYPGLSVPKGLGRSRGAGAGGLDETSS